MIKAIYISASWHRNYGKNVKQEKLTKIAKIGYLVKDREAMWDERLTKKVKNKKISQRLRNNGE